MDVVTEWMRDGATEEDTEEADDPLWRLQNWVADIKGRKTLAASETIHPSSQPAIHFTIQGLGWLEPILGIHTISKLKRSVKLW